MPNRTGQYDPSEFGTNGVLVGRLTDEPKTDVFRIRPVLNRRRALRDMGYALLLGLAGAVATGAVAGAVRWGMTMDARLSALEAGR